MQSHVVFLRVKHHEGAKMKRSLHTQFLSATKWHKQLYSNQMLQLQELRENIMEWREKVQLRERKELLWEKCGLS